jgi:hypothetical protein
VKVPRDNLLGEIGKGHKIAFNILNLGRMKLGVGTVGACKYSLALATRYAKDRQQFGRPIASFGLVSQKLAEMALAAFVSESMGYRTTGLVDDKMARAKSPAEKIDAIEEYTVEASIIKVFGSEQLNYCADETVQIHGGYGYIEDFEPERLLRDSRINRIFEGTNEINRLIVPGTIMKRAAKGQIPLLDHSVTIRERLAHGDIPQPTTKDLGLELQIAELCKWITIYVLAAAVETYHVKVSEEQEVLGDVADMIARVYAIDSVVQRTRQILDSSADEKRKRIARDMLTAYTPRAYGFILNIGRHVLMDICDPSALPSHLEALSRLRLDFSAKVIEAKRRIAAAVVDADGYPLG